MRIRLNEKSAGDNHELDSFFFSLQSSSALKIKNGRYNFHQENTEHLPKSKLPPENCVRADA